MKSIVFHTERSRDRIKESKKMFASGLLFLSGIFGMLVLLCNWLGQHCHPGYIYVACFVFGILLWGFYWKNSLWAKWICLFAPVCFAGAVFAADSSLPLQCQTLAKSFQEGLSQVQVSLTGIGMILGMAFPEI